MRVDFYLLGGSYRDPLEFACALIARAWTGKEKIAVVGPPAALAALDEQLWHQPAGRFLPHDIDPGSAPIALLEAPPDRADILINLNGHDPLPDGEYARVVEIVPRDETGRRLLRERWRAWRQRRAELRHHALK